MHHEFAFVFEDGEEEEALATAAAEAAGVPSEDKPKAAKRPRGAYFTKVEQAQTLRKRRPRVSSCASRG